MRRRSRPRCCRARSPLGEVVKASDLTIARRPKSEAGANVVTVAAQAVGLAARRAMRPGQLIRQTDLMKPEVVARNDNVTITYEVPGIVLTMRGKALETGAKGDIINVLNAASNRTIQATIAGPGHVVSSRAAIVATPPRARAARRGQCAVPFPPQPERASAAPSKRHERVNGISEMSRSEEPTRRGPGRSLSPEGRGGVTYVARAHAPREAGCSFARLQQRPAAAPRSNACA